MGHFTMEDLQELGVAFGLALVDFSSIENCVTCLDLLRRAAERRAGAVVFFLFFVFVFCKF